MASGRAFFERLLKKADITIGGTRAQDITVNDERLFGRVLRQGTLGLGEAGGGTVHSFSFRSKKVRANARITPQNEKSPQGRFFILWRCGELNSGPNLAMKALLRRIVRVKV